MTKSINLSYLNPDEQILYLLKTSQNKIERSSLYEIFPNKEKQIDNAIDSLKLVKIIQENEQSIILFKKMENNFCKIIDFFYSINEPVEKYLFKKQTHIKSDLFDRLLQSNILSICRYVYGHGDYIYLTEKENTMMINNKQKIYEDILNSNDKNKNIADIIYKLWINDNFSKNDKYKLSSDEKNTFNFIRLNNEKIAISDLFLYIYDKNKIKEILINLISNGYISGNKYNGKLWATF